jgi:DNA polymerase
MLTENIVQAISRDLMAEAMINVEKAGYSIVLTVHDEIISEDDEDFGSQEEFEQLMAIVPKWAGNCPVGLAGWEGTRYRKE